jgi:hypothetical protein
MKTKLLLISLLVIFLISSSAPAVYSGYIKPPQCDPHNPFTENYLRFVGHTLSVYVNGSVAAQTIVIMKNNLSYYSITIPEEYIGQFGIFVIEGYTSVSVKILKSGNWTANFCGSMPLIPMKRHK